MDKGVDIENLRVIEFLGILNIVMNSEISIKNPSKLQTRFLTGLGLLLLLLAPVPVRAQHVILISCDGTRPDAITAFGQAHTPTFRRLRTEGAYTDNARTEVAHTTTLQNHTSMITGLPVGGPGGHGWTDNSNPKLGVNLHRNRNAYLPSVFDVAHDHGLKTALLASKTKFSLYDLSYDAQRGAADKIGPDNGKDKIDVCLVSGATVSLVDRLVEELKSSNPPHFSMLHLSNPDAAGHESGWKLESKNSDYMKSIAMVDSLIGRVMETIDTSDQLRGRTHVIVTADHGGLAGTIGHEEPTKRDNFRVPLYVWGPGVKSGAELYSLNRSSRRDPADENPAKGVPPIRNGEVGNLALRILGLPPIPGSVHNAGHDLAFSDRYMELTGTQASDSAGSNPATTDPGRNTFASRNAAAADASPAIRAVPTGVEADRPESPRARVFRAIPVERAP